MSWNMKGPQQTGQEGTFTCIAFKQIQQSHNSGISLVQHNNNNILIPAVFRLVH